MASTRLWTLALATLIGCAQWAPACSCKVEIIKTKSPAGGAQNLYCSVPIQVELKYTYLCTTHEPGNQPPYVEITDAGAGTPKKHTLTYKSGDLYEYIWYTPADCPMGTKTFYIQAFKSDCIHGLLATDLITVTVKNGFIVESATAAVNSPTGAVKSGQIFSLDTSHSVTFRRYDDCQDFTTTYRFRHRTTWDESTDKSAGPFSITLPKALGTYYVNNEFSDNYLADFRLGVYAAVAATLSPPDVLVKEGSHQWSIIE